MWREFWNLDGMSFGCWVESDDELYHPMPQENHHPKKEHSDNKVIAKKKRKKLTFKLK